MSLDRTPQFPPLILPLEEDNKRPLWSVMVPTYNCSLYLKETLESILHQDQGKDNMQIEVVDDCSTDSNVEELVEKIGRGRITFFRHKQNVGSLRNFETCINRARGKLIHLLHGDDKVEVGFYVKIKKLFESYPLIGAAFTGFSGIDEKGAFLYKNDLIQKDEGVVGDWLRKISKNQLLQACSIVVKRSVYEDLGSFYKVHYGEDWEMWVRIAANYSVAYSPDTLAAYRIHNNSISSTYVKTGQNIRDIKIVIDLIEKHLPEETRKKIKNASKKNFAIYFTGNAQQIYKKQHDISAALKQAQGALFLHFNVQTFTSLIKLYIRTILYRFRLSIQPIITILIKNLVL